ncbi:FixH family protein [Paracoccus homiensis]|uniref:Nitrogen fixation protein FixH n=1 Tax=Paracoccus homiensis TaxID=364199 RepID=A0A1I0FF67_9RHOB|nr:FixH family protein [Paracoccus homiensis]SET56643.1 Nitrogen fixation protein FixH [Paracoccus homiensis]
MARELTGRHVLAITVGAFGTIIAVNLVLAVNAVGSFPGLEVANSYVASQQFDRDRQAQAALGWSVTSAHDGRMLTLTVRDEAGLPVRLDDFSATIGRPTHAGADVTPDFGYDGGVYRAELQLEPGAWIIHVTALAPDGTPFRQRLDLHSDAQVRR